MTDFITSFDAKDRKIEKRNMKLSPQVLVFKHLKKSNITKDEKLLIGINRHVLF